MLGFRMAARSAATACAVRLMRRFLAGAPGEVKGFPGGRCDGGRNGVASAPRTWSPRARERVYHRSRPLRKEEDMAVSPVPEGYHTLTTYLAVEDAARASGFYKEAFGAEETVRMHGPDGSVAHAELQIGDSEMMLSDPFPQSDVRPPAQRGGPTASG